MFWHAPTHELWQTIDRDKIDFTADVLTQINLNVTPVTAAPGTRVRWVETRPGQIESVPVRIFLPTVLR